MEMSGEHRIEAPRERVWDALNDPEVLKASIAGCEELNKEGDNAFTAKVRAKVGPVSARFAGKVTLKDLDPPNGYRIEGEGTGGAAGFAKGGATVRLEPDGDATILRYEVQASVGGKLAQIGSRLIDGTARKMADDFFGKFSKIAADGLPPAAVAEPAAAAGAPAAEAVPAATPVAPPTEFPPPADIPATDAEAEARRVAAEAVPEPVAETVVDDAPPSVESPPLPPKVETAGAEARPPRPPAEDAKGISPYVWIGALAVALVIAIYLLS